MITSFEDAMDYLYQALPVFHRIGKVALKPNLNNTIALCDYLGNPQYKFKSIHIAGTNGKGSSSHFLASIFQEAGYKTGLYTSPHLKDFRERIRVDGEMVSTMFVVDFVNRHRKEIEKIQPSFFEVTVAMAFDFFAKEQVDIAIVEVGLGGRLDSTNVIHPVISLITNISYDHMDILGETLPKIAFEKAGIIKSGIPVVISQTQPETTDVFLQKAIEEKSEIYFADQEYRLNEQGRSVNWMMVDVEKNGELIYPALQSGLTGTYQLKNLAGVLKTVDLVNINGFVISPNHLQSGIQKVLTNTGLKGRWQVLSTLPYVVCDIAHNEAGIQEILKQISAYKFHSLHIVLGMAADKEVEKVLSILPKDAQYYFCQASLPRALDSDILLERAKVIGLNGVTIKNVNDAIAAAKTKSSPDDFIFVGGSTFVVAEIDNL